MKFGLATILSTLALLAASANAQPTYIGAPSPGIVVHGGTDITVQVVRTVSSAPFFAELTCLTYP